MNEFIVWDDSNKEWLENKDEFSFVYLYQNGKIGTLFSYGGYDAAFGEINEEEKYSTYTYTGKTDIESNKIYADSSIVELRRIYRHFGGDEILKGFFTFNKETSAYDFISSDEYGNTIIHYNKNIIGHISNLKIIGTLQENRELLNN